jgi:hypothetical protein
MLLTNGKWIYDGLPTELPCGKKVKKGECCRTACPDKNIEECHRKHSRVRKFKEYIPPTCVKGHAT